MVHVSSIPLIALYSLSRMSLYRIIEHLFRLKFIDKLLPTNVQIKLHLHFCMAPCPSNRTIFPARVSPRWTERKMRFSLLKLPMAGACDKGRYVITRFMSTWFSSSSLTFEVLKPDAFQARRKCSSQDFSITISTPALSAQQIPVLHDIDSNERNHTPVSR